MQVYKVIVENNEAVSVKPSNTLQHGDVGYKSDNETVAWLAIEFTDEASAMEIANRVLKAIWGKEKAKS